MIPPSRAVDPSPTVSVGSTYVVVQSIAQALRYLAALALVWDLLLTPQTFELLFGNAPAPPGLHRLVPHARSVRALWRESVPNYVRPPPRATPLETDRLALSPGE